jgi:hypothetical protein
MGGIVQKLPMLIVVLVVAAGGAGCRRSGRQAAVADIRYRVFEAPAEVLDSVIPQHDRIPSDGSDYWFAFGSDTSLSVLLDAMLADSGLLADHTRTISHWPKTADTWAYSKADGRLLGGGGGAGFLGVQAVAGAGVIRIEYDVTHTINTAEPLQLKAIYEGSVPPSGVLIAFKPFNRTDGAALAHVVAFEVANWR